MKNTEYLYTAMNNFRKEQIHNREVYMGKKKNLDRYKGSSGYADDLKKIQKERDDANAAARAKYKETVDNAISCMRNANRKRKCTAPTEEQLRLLTAAKMLQKPSVGLLDSIANSMDGNAIGLAVLQDIATTAYQNDDNVLKKFHPNYAAMASTELTVPAADDAIKSLASTCERIMTGSGVSRVRELGLKRNKEMYGMDYDPDDYPQEPEYSSEKDFYDRELKWTDYALFAAAVNGES
jgi:hypothetical protein